MKTIIVDNDEISREIFLFFAGTIDTLEIVGAFSNPDDAVEYMENHSVELAVLDVRIAEMDGIELGHKLRTITPDLMLIYTTAEDTYSMDVLRLKIAAYLTKPLSREEVLYAIESAKLLSKRKQKRVYARTFGYFDLFVDGKVVLFKSAKAKELLAYLIDRQGGTVTTEQIINVLWEDRPNDEATQSLCSKLVKTLKKELDEYKAGGILIQKRGVRSIDIDLLDCDMYDLMDGSMEAKEHFFGDYMLEYSWAENKTNALWKRAKTIGGRTMKK